MWVPFAHKDNQQHPSNGAGDAGGDLYARVWVEMNRSEKSAFSTARKPTKAMWKHKQG